MKKIIYVIGLFVFLVSCQTKSGTYGIYIESVGNNDKLSIVSSDGVDKEITLPFFENINFTSKGGNTHDINFKSCRINGLSKIRGYVGIDREISLNGQTFYPNQIFAENYQGLPSIMTADSLLNYLKQTGSIGYFEILPTETCKTVSTK